MHKALYREYRPIDFTDVIGQEHIVKTLKNQIREGSINHAYLFCGTRGTGKTTTAKIFSRAINCESEVDEKPCNKCTSCLSILDSSNLDVVEIDAASNNSVDDVREIREAVKYTPSSSRYKVYIIDEVHMLSQGAFNALLKTLEEPPSYAIFILATTEPNKIPATILSRCQRFDFKRVGSQTLVDNMEKICKKEDVSYDISALRVIARNARGSVRDSLSILDKCISFSGDDLTEDVVFDLLGISDPSNLFDLSKSIVDSDLNTCMRVIDDYYNWGKDLRLLTDDVIYFFRSLMMVKIFDSTEDIDFSEEYSEKIKSMADSIDIDDITRILEILSDLKEKLKNSSNQKLTMEVFFMKLSSPSSDSRQESILKRIENIEKLIEDGRISIETKSNLGSNIDIDQIAKKLSEMGKNNNLAIEINKVDKADNTQVDQDAGEKKSVSKSPEKFDIIDDEELAYIEENWENLLNQMAKDKKQNLKVFLLYKKEIRYKNNILYVVIGEDFTMAMDRLNDEENKSYIRDTMKKVFGLDLDLRFILEKDKASMDFGEDSSTDETSTRKKLSDMLGINVEIEEE